MLWIPRAAFVYIYLFLSSFSAFSAPALPTGHPLPSGQRQTPRSGSRKECEPYAARYMYRPLIGVALDMRSARRQLWLARHIWAHSGALELDAGVDPRPDVALAAAAVGNGGGGGGGGHGGMFNVGGERIQGCKQSLCCSASRTTSAHIRPTRKYCDIDLPLPSLIPSI
jgi:hypothetical protein